jgi:hypothetical protein
MREALVLALAACTAPPRTVPPAEQPVAAASPTIPDSPPAPTNRMEHIPALHMHVRLPTTVTIYKVDEEPGPISPSVTLIFTGGSGHLFSFRVRSTSYHDPLVAQRGYVLDGAKRNARIIIDEPDAFLTENTNDLLGEHCDVTACSSTVPRYCVESATGSVYKGQIEKLSSEECRQVIDIMRSVEIDPS